MKTDQRKGLFIRKWRHDISNWKVKTWNCSYKNRSIAHVASSTQYFATRSTSATCLAKLRNERCWNCAILCTWLQKLHKYKQQSDNFEKNQYLWEEATVLQEEMTAVRMTSEEYTLGAEVAAEIFIQQRECRSIYTQIFLVAEIFWLALKYTYLAFHFISPVYRSANTKPAFLNTE